MEEKLRKYVEGLFVDAPKTQKTIELRQEIITNLLEKYRDLLSSGATEEEAYEIVKKSIGNVDELIDSLYDGSPEETREENEMNRKKSAMFKSVSVMLYIASPIFIVALSVAGQWLLGLVLLLGCIAVATGLRVYANSVYSGYRKMDDTMVEEFKEWKAENREKEDNKKAFMNVFWLFVTVVYFVVSFATMAWYITWVIWLIGAAVEQLIKINMKDK